jgi:cytochrome b6-f complex iron-sulfur subunit
MNRKEFIKSLGLGAAFVLTTNCFQSCAREFIGPIDFMLDLRDPKFQKLKTDGEYVVTSGVVVAKTTKGQYVAATVICSHEKRREVVYDQSNDIFFCTAHAAEYDLNGIGLNDNGRKGLTVYIVEVVDDNTLHIHD